MTGAAVVAPPPPPEPVAAPATERVVPFKEVFALEEMPVMDAASGLVVAAVLEGPESGELELTGVSALVMLLRVEESVDTAEVEVAGSDEFAPEEGVSSALPAEGAAPFPAPEEEPAVFDPPVEEPPVEDA